MNDRSSSSWTRDEDDDAIVRATRFERWGRSGTYLQPFRARARGEGGKTGGGARYVEMWTLADARAWVDRSIAGGGRASVGWWVGGGTIARARGTRRRATDWLYVRYPRRRTRPRRLDVRVDRRR